jgi:phosphoglycolate phosphatase-like HAD superfamily hydrolase
MLETLDLQTLKNVETVFLDDGGVMSDNRRRAPEWVRLIGVFMPPRLGGTPEQWGYHNQRIIRQVLDDVFGRLSSFASHREFQRIYATNWMTAMCQAMAIEMPDNGEELYRELSIYVAEHAKCECPGAGDAVRGLHRAGYQLFTASGTASWELRGIVSRMGIADLFETLYGPDLIDRVKYGPNYYELVFAHAGVVPAQALVVDSDLECCEWARKVGAKAVWVDHDGRAEMSSLAALVDVMLRA